MLTDEEPAEDEDGADTFIHAFTSLQDAGFVQAVFDDIGDPDDVWSGYDEQLRDELRALFVEAGYVD